MNQIIRVTIIVAIGSYIGYSFNPTVTGSVTFLLGAMTGMLAITLGLTHNNE